MSSQLVNVLCWGLTKIRVQNLLSLSFFFFPSRGRYFRRNNLGEYQKGVMKNLITIICTRNWFKHGFHLVCHKLSFTFQQAALPTLFLSLPLSLPFPVPSCGLLGVELRSLPLWFSFLSILPAQVSSNR